MMMVLRNRLNRILHDRGLAEGEVALVARLDQGHLNRIKNGRVKPTLVTALRIAHALGTPVNQLFYLEGLDADLEAGVQDGRVAPAAQPGTAPPVERRRGPERAIRPASTSPTRAAAARA
jgi:transcriptional regulator with XRE-family HTH domain